MANNAGAKKRIRQIERKTDANRIIRTRARTFIRKVEEAIVAGDKKTAEDAFRAAESKMMAAAQRNIFHKNMASRKLSRLSSRIKALG